MNFKNSTAVVLLCLFSIFSHFNSISQATIGKEQKQVLRINMDTDAGFIKGYVYNLTDSTVTISRDFIAYKHNISINDAALQTFNYRNVNNITRTRNGSVPIGALAGAATGALIGLASYQKPDRNAGFTIDFGPGPLALSGGILGAAAGTLGGLLLHKHKFHVNRDMKRFKTFKLNVLRKVNSNQ